MLDRRSGDGAWCAVLACLTSRISVTAARPQAADRCDQQPASHDVHDASEIVGEDVQTRGSVFIRKWIAPMRALIVPKEAAETAGTRT